MSRIFTTAQEIKIKTMAYQCAMQIVREAKPTPEELRMASGLTMQELAEAANVTPAMLRKFEDGKGKRITRDHMNAMRRIAAKLNVSDSAYFAAVARQREKNRDSARRTLPQENSDSASELHRNHNQPRCSS